ncbi:hypothetical protein CEXT_610142 [Caerostris extrusa]|uniref:Uncharacterized protein n=1 Tax=Caerostris extrusa TaxID=172846 RepID=A0AAV4XZF2_CAEEX|nr:hypothetical protein CEXT_610142 [Caerostris extrusa]
MKKSVMKISTDEHEDTKENAGEGRDKVVNGAIRPTEFNRKTQVRPECLITTRIPKFDQDTQVQLEHPSPPRVPKYNQNSKSPGVRWPTKPSDSPFLRCFRLVLHLIGLRHDTLGTVPPAPHRTVPCSGSAFSEMHEKPY